MVHWDIYAGNPMTNHVTNPIYDDLAFYTADESGGAGGAGIEINADLIELNRISAAENAVAVAANTTALAAAVANVTANSLVSANNDQRLIAAEALIAAMQLDVNDNASSATDNAALIQQILDGQVVTNISDNVIDLGTMRIITGSEASTSSNQAFTFPIPFASVPIVTAAFAQASDTNVARYQGAVFNTTLTGFRYNRRNSMPNAGAPRINYVAIGRNVP